MSMTDGATEWFVMRDLKRANALEPAHKMLAQQGFEVFTPMQWRVIDQPSGRKRVLLPVVRDLLFVHTTRAELDPVVKLTPTLQYRYVRGAYLQPMTVPIPQMKNFIQATTQVQEPRYFQPGELTPAMVGRAVRVISGPLAGMETRLLKVRGSRAKRVIVDLPGLLSTAVEVSPTQLELL